MCAASAVKFLATLGVYNMFLFYGISDGPHIHVNFCYAVPPVEQQIKIGTIYMSDRHGYTFETKSPIGSYYYATFLTRLAVLYAPKFQQAVEDAISRNEIVRKIEGNDPSLRWTLRHQVDYFVECGLLTSEEDKEKIKDEDEKLRSRMQEELSR